MLDNDGDPLTLSADGTFSFAAPVAFNAPYAVTVGTQPLWQNCSVSNGSGTATADVSSVQVNCIEALAQVTTLAGSTVSGWADGTGAAAAFNAPQALAVNRSGNVYVADANNHRIRQITPDGSVTTFAGSGIQGWTDGSGATAQLTWPDGVAVDGNGNVYEADGAAIRKITPDGFVRTLAGSANVGFANGTGANALFAGPAGLAVDAGGNVYVADYYNNMIRKVTPDGVVTTLAGSTTPGSSDGIGAAASFQGPAAVELDAAGNLYVTEYDNCMIRKISPDSVVTTLAGSTTCGFADGTGAAARFDEPYGLAIDASGVIYVADGGNNRIRRITPDGVVTTIAGSGVQGSTDGIGNAAQFSAPTGVAVDADGNLYVSAGNSIRKLTPVR